MHQQQTAFENIVGKAEIANNEQLQCLLLNQIIVSPLVHIFDIISLFVTEFEKPKIDISGKGLIFLSLTLLFVASPWHFVMSLSSLNLFPNKPWFLCVFRRSILKTLWEKEKLLIKSNFSFFHSVFYPFGELSAIFITFENVVFKVFQFGRV